MSKSLESQAAGRDAGLTATKNRTIQYSRAINNQRAHVAISGAAGYRAAGNARPSAFFAAPIVAVICF
jgi:hypothetical protein